MTPATSTGARPIKVLLVEDNPGDARLILELLREVQTNAFELKQTDRLQAALDHIKHAAVDIVLLDLGLPDSQGLETFQQVREHLGHEPVVVISGLDDERVALEAVRSGAQDYLVKGRIEGELLARVIRYAIERKRTEQVLRDREQRFSQLVDNIQEVFFIMDAQFHETIYISPAYADVWGVTCETLYADPQSFLAPVPPDDRAQLLDSIARTQRGEETDEVEFRVTRPDGDVRWVRARSVPVRNQQGEVYRLCGIVLDVTKRRQAEEALRASERRARTLFETVHLIVLGLDAGGRVDYVNPYLSQLSGYTREELIGRDWRDLLPPAQHAALGAVFRELIGGELHPHYEYAIVTKSGEERMIAWNNTVVRDADGRPTGTLSIGEDITDRLRLEKQFLQAQKMEAVGRLAGGIAHDFNNVLTAIFAYTDLLAADLPADSPARQDADDIQSAARRAAALTRQLLAFSRRQVLQPVVLNLNELVQDFETMLQRVVGEDIDLQLALPPGLGNVRADPGQLQQVVMNLVVNARDAMPNGGKLLIETANAELTAQYAGPQQAVVPGPHVMLAVSDTGTGMDAETRARIFEPFFTTKEKGKGTGLGLSTVYGIVKQSGGYIWVYSDPGRGTAFKIYLPQVDAPIETAGASRETATLTGTETILLAEDDDMLRPLTSSLLAKLGYTVLEAANAAEALAIASAHEGPIDLLVSDIVMPGASGRQLAERLGESRPATRVLYVSGYTDEAIVRHGMLEPGLNFLQKPFTPTVLARKVRDVLDAS